MYSYEIKSEETEGLLTIVLKGQVTNDEWRTQYGSIQTILRNQNIINEPFQEVHFDLSCCTEIEPTPILGILISIHELKGSVKKRLTLPSLSKGYKICRFFYIHGVLFHLLEADVTVDAFDEEKSEFVNINHTWAEQYGKHKQFVIDIDFPVLPAQIIDLAKMDNDEDFHLYISTLVESLLFGELEDSYNRDNTKQMIYQILLETLSNVREHAYPDKNPSCWAGILIRGRYGVYSPKNNNHEINNQIRAEKEWTHRLAIDDLETVSQMLEIFIIDAGVGIYSTLCESHEFLDFMRNRNYHPDMAIAAVVAFSFMQGKRRMNRPQKLTAFGGLFLLFQMLKEQNTFFYLTNEHSSIGFYGSSKEKDLNSYVYRFIDHKYNNRDFYYGTIIDIMIKPQKRPVSLNSISIWTGTPEAHPALLALSANDKGKGAEENVFFYDARDLQIAGLKRKPPIKNKAAFQSYYWFPHSLMSKDEILKNLRKYALSIVFYYIMRTNNLNSQLWDTLKKTNESLYNQLKRYRGSISSLYDFLYDNPTQFGWFINYMQSQNYLDIDAMIYTDFNKATPLIIMDVPSSSMSAYIVSLNGSYTGSEELIFISRFFSYIIVISDSFEVASFVNYMGTYKLNQSLSRRLFGNNFSVGDIRLGLLSKAVCFLRLHNSNVFWGELIDFQKNENIEYYVNTSIEWSIEKSFTGYLNIEEVLNNPTLSGLLRHFIKQIAGFFQAENDLSDIYIETIDYPAKRLVYTLSDFLPLSPPNGKIKGRTIQVRLGSIHLTGNTIEEKIHFNRQSEENTTQIRVCILIHPESDDMIKSNISSALERKRIKLYSILLWPAQQWLDQKVKKKQDTYYRIGYTHDISPEKRATYISQEKIENSKVYYCKRDKQYKLMQSSFPRIFDIGHYSYHGKHSFYNFRFFSELTKTTYIKSDMFRYILLSIVLGFKISSYKNESIIMSLPEQWSTMIKNLSTEQRSDFSSWNFSVIVYSSHYYNDLFVTRLKEILPQPIIKSFVPINFLPTENGTYSISPYSIERLKKHILENFASSGTGIDKQESLNVLFFDTMISTGRTRKVIKSILLSDLFRKLRINIENVMSLSIIDSQCFPYAVPDYNRNRAYIRLNIPEMGSKKTCSLCNAIYYAREIQADIIINSYKKTVQNWIDIWSERPLSSIESHSFLHDEKMANGVYYEGFYITSTYGAVAAGLELQSIYTEDNSLEKLIGALEDDFSANTCALMICSKLLVYGNYRSITYQIHILSKLLNLMLDIKEADGITSLVCLTLLLQPLDIVVPVLIEISRKVNYSQMNSDMQVLLGYYSYRSPALFLCFPAEITDIFDRKLRIRAYQILHATACNDHGITHENALQRFSKIPPSISGDDLVNQIKSALLIIKTAINQLKVIEDSELRSKINGEPSVLDIDSLDVIASMIQTQLEKIIQINNLKPQSVWDSSERASIFKGIENFNRYIVDVINESLFIRAGSPPGCVTSYVYNEIQKMILKVKRELKDERLVFLLVEPPRENIPNGQKVWYIWNEEIKLELYYLIHNVRQKKCRMTNNSDMIIELDPSLTKLRITLRNASVDDHNEVINKTMYKGRANTVRNRELGVVINYNSKKENKYYELLTIIDIPAISKLNSHE